MASIITLYRERKYAKRTLCTECGVNIVGEKNIQAIKQGQLKQHYELVETGTCAICHTVVRREYNYNTPNEE